MCYFRVHQIRLVHSRKWLLLPAYGWYFVCWPLQTEYVYRQSRHPKLWTKKYHTPIVQRLEHSSCTRGSLGSIRAIFHFTKIGWFENNGSQSKLGVVTRARLAFRMSNFRKQDIYLHARIKLIPYRELQNGNWAVKVHDRVSGAPTWWASRLGPMWEASRHMSLVWWWTMVSPIQLCWWCHGLRLGQRYILYHPAAPSLVVHGQLTLTPQCTLWCARDTPDNLCEEI